MAGANIHASDQSATNFEARVNIITLIARRETPFLSKMKRMRTTNTRDEWNIDEYDVPNKDNAVKAGDDVSTSSSDYKVRTSAFNNTQIPRKQFGVTFQQDAVGKPQLGTGKRSEYNYQKQKKTIEIARDIESMLLSDNERVAPSDTVIGKLRGAQRWIQNNQIKANAGNTKAILAQSMFDSAMARSFNQGGSPGIVFANLYQKNRVARFVTPTGRTIDETGKKLVNVVNTYETATGITDIVLNVRLDGDVVLFLDMNFWMTAWLRGFFTEQLGATGGKTRGYVEAEITLRSMNEKASAKITGLQFIDYGTAA